MTTIQCDARFSAVGKSLIRCSAAVLLLGGLSVSQASAALVHWWPIDVDTNTATHLTDVIGGQHAVATGIGTTNPATLQPGATGLPNEAAVVPANTTNSGGYQTGLTNLGSAFTYETMFRFNNYTTNGWGYLVGRLQSGGFGGPIEIAFRNPGNGAGYATIRDGANAGNSLGNFNYQLTAAGTHNGWYHVAMTYDGTDATLYVSPFGTAHGSPTSLVLSANLPGLTAQHSYGLGLGNTDSHRFSLNGAMDWAAVYNRALTQDELTANNFNNSPLLTVIPEPGTFAMAAVGLLGLGLLVWRRSRRR